MASELQLLEVFRLAALGGESGIATEVSDRLTRSWLTVSRFRDVDELTTKALKLERSPRTLNLAGQAKATLGDVQGALGLYEEAAQLYEASGDRAGLEPGLRATFHLKTHGSGTGVFRLWNQALLHQNPGEIRV